MSKAMNVIGLFAGKRVPAQAQVNFYNRTDALKRASRALAYCWGAGLLTLPVPVLHLVLPPLLAVGGVVAFVLVYLRSPGLPKNIEGVVICGNCQAQTHFEFHKATAPFYSECASCRVGYEILVEAQQNQS